MLRDTYLQKSMKLTSLDTKLSVFGLFELMSDSFHTAFKLVESGCSLVCDHTLKTKRWDMNLVSAFVSWTRAGCEVVKDHGADGSQWEKTVTKLTVCGQTPGHCLRLKPATSVKLHYSLSVDAQSPREENTVSDEFTEGGTWRCLAVNGVVLFGRLLHHVREVTR